MIEDLKRDASERMQKSVSALAGTLAKLRTGRAHPSLLEQISLSYYGTPTPLTQVANIAVEDGRTLTVTPWEPQMIPEVEKAIQNSKLDLNPVTAGKVVRVPLPDLTEERRKDLARLVKQEAEQGRVAVRNVRRDVMSDLKTLLKEKAITEDDERRGQELVQQLTDAKVKQIDKALEVKEADLMEI